MDRKMPRMVTTAGEIAVPGGPFDPVSGGPAPGKSLLAPLASMAGGLLARLATATIGTFVVVTYASQPDLEMSAPPPPPAERPLVIAHRGYSGIAPEHTLAAYDLAHAAGADYLEQDLQMTSDGVLVVMHDATLDRTVRGLDGESCSGPVIEHTLAELRACDAGRWFNERNPELAREEYVGLKVPTLEEVFERFGGSARYYIETKNPEEAPGMEEALVGLLRRHGLPGNDDSPPRVIVQSFSAESLRKLRSLEPGLFLVRLLGRMSSEELRAEIPEIAAYAQAIGPHFSSVDDAAVRAAHQAGLVVHPYTVNEPDEMLRLRSIGIDGFFTDHTPRALEVLR